MTTHRIDGKTVAFLATDGVEQAELEQPWQAVKDAGGSPVLISLADGTIQGFNHIDKGDTFTVDLTVSAANVADYDGLVLPGGVVNSDLIRADETAVAFTRGFFDQHKPVAAICHAGWTLAEADVVRGRTMTSFPSLATDLRNAGATWVDEEVVVDEGLVTSRNPDDLPAFNAKVIEEIAEGPHAAQHA